MRFLIPSYRRSEKCRTARYLHSLGYSREQIHIATQTEEDFRAYEATYGSVAVVHYREAQNCAGNRNTLVGLLEDGEECLLMDDDVRSVYRYEPVDGQRYGKLVSLDREGFDSLLAQCSDLLASGVSLVCIFDNANTMNVHRNWEKGAHVDYSRLAVGSFMYTRKESWLRFDETLPCNDDTELSLRLIFEGRKTARLNLYAANKPQDTKEGGGCFEVYQSGRKVEVLKELERRYYPLAAHKKDWTGMRLKAGLR